MNMNMNPTKRFVIEPLLKCNIKCLFCYHLHKYNEWDKYTKSFETVKSEIDAGKARGNEWMDITGGEPTYYSDIIKVVEYAHSIGLKVCIITNGIIGEKRTQELIDFGIDEFLVSRHGLESEHNYITNTKNAYRFQIRFLNQIKNKIRLRFNCVITKYNQSNLLEIAKELNYYNPKIINFINFNPLNHSNWANHEDKSGDFIADLRIVKNNIAKAIVYLENKGIGVNIRYYPMCMVLEKYRRCVCNDLHVMHDPYEWDYGTMPKTTERFHEWEISTSHSNEEKNKPCCNCNLQWICGGVNKNFHVISNKVYGEILEPVKNIYKNERFYYRQNNEMTLEV